MRPGTLSTFVALAVSIALPACGASTRARTTTSSTASTVSSAPARQSPGTGTGESIEQRFASVPSLQQAFTSFASCMVAHGYPGFPTTYAAAASQVNAQSPQFTSADAACSSILVDAEHAAGFGPGSGTGIGGGPFAPGNGQGTAGNHSGGGNGGGTKQR